MTGFERIEALVGKPAFAVLASQAQHYGRCLGWRRGLVAVADKRGVVRLAHGRCVGAWWEPC